MAQDDYDGGYCTCSKCKAWDVAAKGKYRVVLCSKHGFDVEVQNTAWRDHVFDRGRLPINGWLECSMAQYLLREAIAQLVLCLLLLLCSLTSWLLTGADNSFGLFAIDDAFIIIILFISWLMTGVGNSSSGRLSDRYAKFWNHVYQRMVSAGHADKWVTGYA